MNLRLSAFSVNPKRRLYAAPRGWRCHHSQHTGEDLGGGHHPLHPHPAGGQLDTRVPRDVRLTVSSLVYRASSARRQSFISSQPNCNGLLRVEGSSSAGRSFLQALVFSHSHERWRITPVSTPGESFMTMSN